MGELTDSLAEAKQCAPGSPPEPSLRTGNWKPVLTLLVLSPAVGELLSGSSPPLQFFNPIFFLLLVGLYGCGALLVRETAARRHLPAGAILLLGAAYGIVEEGLMCKSFFNPYWTDTGYLSVYGRAGGVNWVWVFGLTFYHMVVSITVPIFLTQALFPLRAERPWLRRRGCAIAAVSLGLVVLLGFFSFDNRQFHLIEMTKSLELAQRLNSPSDALEQFMAGQLTAKNRVMVRKAAAAQADSPELRHALQEELNRLLPRADLYSPERFARVTLPEDLQRQTTKLPHGDKLVTFNRALLERAFPGILPSRPVYPFRPGWALTAGSVMAVLVLVILALRQVRPASPAGTVGRPWLMGLSCTIAFVVVGFVLPGLVEHGAKIPAILICAIWCVLAALVGHVLRRWDSGPDEIWRRGLWAIGVITPWVFFATLLGIFVGMIGAKSFSGMPIVALGFAVALLTLARKWSRQLLSQREKAGVPPPVGETKAV